MRPAPLPVRVLDARAHVAPDDARDRERDDAQHRDARDDHDLPARQPVRVRRLRAQRERARTKAVPRARGRGARGGRGGGSAAQEKGEHGDEHAGAERDGQHWAGGACVLACVQVLVLRAGASA